MAKILITSGPTRQYLDPVRYLTNASSGRMGAALAAAALAAGHQVLIVSGPVDVEYPLGAEILWVVSTEEMLAACRKAFPDCDGLIGAAAPCDYRPERVAQQKMSKTGQPIELRLIETDDVVATLGIDKQDRWMVGFALETDDARLRALAKMEKKLCDLMVLNGPQAMHSLNNEVEVLDRAGNVLVEIAGAKEYVAERIFAIIQERLID
ncbi:MAG: phosphopantothenoylcysteine decarboxylase [Pirellulales bacterium]